MLGCRQGFVTRIRDACKQIGGNGIVANWCGSHQLNLVIGEFLDVLDDYTGFRPTLCSEISFTHTHNTVQKALDASCPSYAETRWDSIHDTCQFLAQHHAQFIKLQEEKTDLLLVRNGGSFWF